MLFGQHNLPQSEFYYLQQQKVLTQDPVREEQICGKLYPAHISTQNTD